MLSIGILIFPQVEELDFVGPFEVLSYVNKIQPGSSRVQLIAAAPEAVTAANGLRVLPDVTIAKCPPLDVLLIPGGQGRLTAMKDPYILRFLQEKEPLLRFLASVCTGAFLLAEAGLLAGRSAATHSSARQELAGYGVRVQSGKVIRDGRIVTSGGVSSGLELSFWLLRELLGLPLAREAARRIEYAIDWDTL